MPAPSSDERFAVVVNGNAKRVTDDLIAILDEIVRSGDLFVSRSLEEGKDIAARIVARGYPLVLTGGGDGTFGQMVTWIVRDCDARGIAPPRFGLLKLGTGNALAWVLGAENRRGRGVVPDLARLRRSSTKPLYLIEVDERLTLFAGMGADAIALQDFEEVKAWMQRLPVLRSYGTGALAYAIAIVGRSMPRTLVKPKFEARVINLGGPVRRIGPNGAPTGPAIATGAPLLDGKCRAVFGSTIPYWGFGARVFPFASDREDRFHLRMLDIGPLQVAGHIRSIWRGTYRDPRVYDFLVEHVSIESTAPVPCQVGGDGIGARRTLELRLRATPIQVVDHYGPPEVD
ncbi:MAG: hypothetical protein KC543_16380 [Myxococcales bacterium]|nr:hypothetical protein [Myxococcales bacterium]